MTDPTSRALGLLGLLESRASWSGDELAERLGVTPRTVRRDIDRLRGLGYVVEADAGPGGGYALGRGQLLPPLLLDEEQAVAVTLALTRAAREGDGPGAEAALRALGTIDAVTPLPVRRRLAALREAAQPAHPVHHGDEDVLMPCAEAVRRRLRLTFHYTDRHGAGTERSVEPHRLVAGGRTWRLVAFDLVRDDWRVFRLDRLAEPRAGTWTFTPRPGLDAVLERLGEPVPPEVWRHRIVVRIRASRAEVARTMPTMTNRLHPVHGEAGGGEERGPVTEVHTGADDPAEIARWLATLRHEFTVEADDDVIGALHDLAGRLTRTAVP